MPEPKAQLVDPQGPIDVPGLSVTGVTTATGGFVGAVQGAATGLASTTANLSVGIVTATKFQGNTTGNVSGLADDTNINVGIITSTSFTGDLVGNAAGLSTTTANINAGIMSATSFAGNFTGVASGITGTPNIVVGIMTGTLNGDGSSLTGIAATNWITNNVTANSSTTTVNLSLGNVVKFTQSANTTVSFANTGTSNIVTFLRFKDANSTARTLTWPDSIKWNGGSSPTLNADNTRGTDFNLINLLTRDEGVTWYGWENASQSSSLGLWTFGAGNYGQDAQNNLTDYSSPVQIPGTTWSKADGAGNHSTGIKSDGTLWAWGYGGSGELSQNSVVSYSSPVQIGSGTDWSFSIGIAAKNWALKTDGTLWTWGNGGSGALGVNNHTQYSSPVQIPGTTWRTIECGGSIASATRTNGTLWVWGQNEDSGSNGDNQTSSNASSPKQVPGTTWSTEHGHCDQACFAIKTNGTLWAWGQNGRGQLAQNNTVQYSSPVQIPGTTWSKVLGSTDGGGVEGWYGATKTDGTLWMWGSNNEGGALGQNEASVRYSSPVQVPGTNWNTISGSNIGVRATKTDGTLWVWGNNGYGKLGLNSSTQHWMGISSPTQIPGTSWSGVVGGKGSRGATHGFKY